MYKIGFSSSWTLGYSYPNGTQINVLYYDGLVVGTGTGLYDQSWGGGALPVELTTFEGTAGENFVRLSWRTATEVNNYGFEVQRSPLDSPYGKGGKSGGWSELGFVKGGGTNNSSIRYSFIDNNISTSGVYLYRLKQIDLDGSYKFSKTIDVAVKKPESFSLEQNYPNPFNPSTTIRYSIPQAGNVRIELYNMLGENIAVLVNEKKEAGSYKIQLSAESFHLASGVYIYKMRSGKYSIARKLMLLK